MKRDEGPTDEYGAPHLGDDRELWDGSDRPRAMRLIQGYIWHPREAAIDLSEYVPAELEGAELPAEVHVLMDAMPAAPFAFFDDGTLSATQQVYQLTVLRIVPPGENPATGLQEVAARLQEHLDTTPEGVGWQLMEDLREVD